eukprot:scaffold89120_cov22-Tisochrysis_lutea.AAC.1
MPNALAVHPNFSSLPGSGRSPARTPPVLVAFALLAWTRLQHGACAHTAQGMDISAAWCMIFLWRAHAAQNMVFCDDKALCDDMRGRPTLPTCGK